MLPAVGVAFVLMLVARPIAVFVCLGAVPLQLAREKIFIAWTGLRGAVAIFLASIPMLVGLSKAYLYFDVAFVVVIISLLLQGWTLAPAARKLHVALPRAERGPRRVELDLPGQLEQQLVGYPVRAKSLYFRRGLIPSWSKPTLVIRNENILTPVEADPIAPGDYIYCWPRRRRPNRSTASSSTCSRARRLIRICSATSWFPRAHAGRARRDLRRERKR